MADSKELLIFFDHTDLTSIYMRVFGGSGKRISTVQMSKCLRIPLQIASRLVAECVSISSSCMPFVSNSIDPAKNSAAWAPTAGK